jgi:hypothetical protein
MGISSEKWIGRSAVTPHPCSGHCCGNPRAYGGGGCIGDDWPRIDDVWE